MSATKGRGDRDLILSATIMGLGMHLAAWRQRDGEASDYVDPDLYRELARTAEAGKLHCIFLADTLTNAEEGADRPALGALDPAVLLSTMAGVTERVGLVGTASTTFNAPFDLARRFSTLDHLSRGRAGWNAVTTFVPAVAENFGGTPLPDREQRYENAAEFIEVVLALWESWGEGALLGDKAGGRFADPELVRSIDHRGKSYEVRGPLTMPRSPQGRPALFQAGSSEAGRDLAAHFADVVFTAQNVLDAAVGFRADVRERTAAYGRDPDSIKIVPGILPILGATEAEARARKAELDDLAGTGPELGKLARRIGLPIELLKLDEQIPFDKLVPEEQFSGSLGFRRAALQLAEAERLTVRELLVRNGGGHLQVIGTAEQVADKVEQWHGAGAVDGFNIMVDVVPSGLHDAVDQLVPELQRRGLLQTEYEHETLRENLGVVAPKTAGAAA
ncbi:MAG TPA: LLM class flavin-dependent oxidoreductase [Conexibacter sp.]|jgi:FMN-dependent oxidoreductase (nitrilotriacetate monooxygenase family)